MTKTTMNVELFLDTCTIAELELLKASLLKNDSTAFGEFATALEKLIDQKMLEEQANKIRMLIPEHRRPPLNEFIIYLNSTVQEVLEIPVKEKSKYDIVSILLELGADSCEITKELSGVKLNAAIC